MPPSRPRIRLVVVQPTPFCNIDCHYCYLPNRQLRRTMSTTTIRRLFERIFSSGWVEEKFLVNWHAGEPMVLGVEYYEAAFEIIESLRPPDVAVVHGIQTNGTLLSQAWCDFIKREHVEIGVSIDGPRELHDLHRVTSRGAAPSKG